MNDVRFHKKTNSFLNYVFVNVFSPLVIVLFTIKILTACNYENETDKSKSIIVAGKKIPSKGEDRKSMFIAHRGVHFKCSLAGENSIESIQYAKRAGF